MLDVEELRETRKLNKSDTSVRISLTDIDKKIKQLEDMLIILDDEYEYYHVQGKLTCLRAIQKGDISKL